MQEVLGTELEVDQEYYVEKQFRIARSNGEQTWHTQEKYSAIYYGPFEHNQGGFIAKQIYRGRAIVNKMYIIHLRIPQIRTLLTRIERDFTERPTHKKIKKGETTCKKKRR